MASDRSALADRLGGGPDEPSVVVVGGQAATGIASHLQEDHEVALLSDAEWVVRAARRAGIDAEAADVTSGDELAARVEGTERGVVAATRDRKSLLVTQLLRTVCDVDDVAVRLNDPANRLVFDDVDAGLLDGRAVLGPAVERELFGEST